MKKRWIYMLLSVVVVLLLPLWGQSTHNARHEMDVLIAAGKLPEANQLFERTLHHWKMELQGDSLLPLISLKGKLIETETESGPERIELLSHFVEDLVKLKVNDSYKAKFFNMLAHYADNQNNNDFAYHAMLRSVDFQSNVEMQDELRYLAACYYDLGVYAIRMGNVEAGVMHHRRAIEIKSSLDDKPLEEIYFSYSALANVFWYELKLDSSEYYFNKALEVVAQLPPEPINKYYRKALLSNGLFGIYKERGRMEDAIAMAYEIIDEYQQFCHLTEDKNLVSDARSGAFEVIDNLAVTYESIGNMKRGLALKQYSRQQKEHYFGADFYGNFYSDILLGYTYYAMHEYDLAETSLQRGIAGLKADGGDHTFWMGDAWWSLARVYHAKNKQKESLQAYHEAEHFYQRAYGETMDNMYADFMRDYGQYLAQNHQYKAAKQVFRKIKNYLDVNTPDNLVEYYHFYQSLAGMEFFAENYRETIFAADKALSFIQMQFHKNGVELSGLDSFKIEFYMPDILLMKAKAKYRMQSQPDAQFLKNLYAELDSAVQMVERRKFMLTDDEDVKNMLRKQEELFQFSSKILLELHKKTADKVYEHQYIQLREQNLYTTIRTHILQQRAIRFYGIPDSVIHEEHKLKRLLGNPTISGEWIDEPKADNDWRSFLTRLEKEYPHYYRLMYAKKSMSPEEIKEQIPPNTNLVRYYLEESGELAVWIADNEKDILLQLPAKNLNDLLEKMDKNALSEPELIATMYALYQILWEPITAYVQNKSVLIVPDGILYRINIESLPTKACSDFESLANASLLQKHSFSYLYSPLLLNHEPIRDRNFKNYVAFVPGFTDQLKEKYLQQLSDSIYFDRDYMKLLPQPFSNRLAHKLKKKLGGKLFTGKKSTVENFIAEANGHKLVHIASHAEFNNILPEQSGLYFSKGNTDHNFFTLKDVLASRIESDLLILTACESGKAGYRDGEGLVSLSHAFNYAGSSNILTAIRKIDEYASSQITDYFVANLLDGKATDEALRLAKLSYLNNAEGRLLHPDYWSGLVLMGQPDLISLVSKKSVNKVEAYVLVCGLLLIAGLTFFIVRRKKR